MGLISSKTAHEQKTVDKKSPVLNYKISERISKFLPSHVLKNWFLSTEDNQPARLELVARQFLQFIAYGKEEEAEAILLNHLKTENSQWILCVQAGITDYSGRTFNCSAYEYAYWAKDTYMCRMLEKYMNAQSKVITLARISKMESLDIATGQPFGLIYQQDGGIHRSAQFDFTPLIKALEELVANCDTWFRTNDMTALKSAWLILGKAQRNVPAHVANEYCRRDRSFYPIPLFNEDKLPRHLNVFNRSNYAEESWFPLKANCGLGFTFAFMRVCINGCFCGDIPDGIALARQSGYLSDDDLKAMKNLDKVRSAELMLLRERLHSLLYIFTTPNPNEIIEMENKPFADDKGISLTT